MCYTGFVEPFEASKVQVALEQSGNLVQIWGSIWEETLSEASGLYWLCVQGLLVSKDHMRLVCLEQFALSWLEICWDKYIDWEQKLTGT